MTDCLELLGEIVAIYPVEKGLLQFAVPFNVVVDRLSAEDIIVPDQKEGYPITHEWLNAQRGIILDGYFINNECEGSIIMDAGASAKESITTVSAGKYYLTKITAQTYDSIDKLRSLYRDVSEMDSFDTFIVDDMERVFVLRADEPSCAISMSANLPISKSQSIEIEVASVSGLIPVMFG